MKHILQILPELNPSGGIENVVMNYYRHIDRNRFQFDFISHSIKDNTYVEEIDNLGGRVHLLPKFTPSNFPRIRQKYSRILSKKQYAAVHCNMANAAFLYLKEARRNSVPLRILHSHQNKYADTFSHALRNVPLVALGKSYANVRVACSDSAGHFLFGKNSFIVLPNAIDLKKFQFSSELRRLKRKELGISDTQYIIGNVGRLTSQKNQAFLIGLMPDILKNNSKAVLLIIGEGRLRAELEKLCLELGVAASVRFLGIRTDVNELLNAMDCFAFPSFYEGLGEALIEAEVCGLPCFSSTNVPTAAHINNCLRQIDLGNYNEWVRCLSNAKVVEDRAGFYNLALHTEYDITESSKILEKVYDNNID